MPLDQRGFEIETKHEVFSLEGLIAWLETQPAHRAYCWHKSGECLLAQYTIARGGYIHQPIFGDWLYVVGDERIQTTMGADSPIHMAAYGDGESTYGAALTRARQALRDRAQP